MRNTNPKPLLILLPLPTSPLSAKLNMLFLNVLMETRLIWTNAVSPHTGLHILELVPWQGHTKTVGASPLPHSIT
jgi:hypothetical protein